MTETLLRFYLIIFELEILKLSSLSLKFSKSWQLFLLSINDELLHFLLFEKRSELLNIDMDILYFFPVFIPSSFLLLSFPLYSPLFILLSLPPSPSMTSSNYWFLCFIISYTSHSSYLSHSFSLLLPIYLIPFLSFFQSHSSYLIPSLSFFLSISFLYFHFSHLIPSLSFFLSHSFSLILPISFLLFHSSHLSLPISFLLSHSSHLSLPLSLMAVSCQSLYYSSFHGNFSLNSLSSIPTFFHSVSLLLSFLIYLLLAEGWTGGS